MADRYPLIVDSATNTIKELPSGDSLDLSSSNIVNTNLVSATSGIFSGTTSSDMVRITQLGSGNALVVEDSANPDATSFVVNASGSVGIGTANPNSLLTLNAASNPGLEIDVSNTMYARLIADTGSSATFLESFNGYPLAFSVIDAAGGRTERLRITSSGNVGIGTTNPLGRLQVGAGSSAFIVTGIGSVGIGTTRVRLAGIEEIKLHVAGNMMVGIGTTQNWLSFFGTTNDDGGNHTFIGERIWNIGKGQGESSELVLLKANDNSNAGVSPDDPQANLDRIRLAAAGGIMFQTHEAGFGGNDYNFGGSTFEGLATDPDLRTRMIITNEGKVGIATSSPAQTLHLNGTFRFTSRGTPSTQTALHVNTSTGDVIETASSRRFKRDIEDYDKGLETLLQLRPVSFKFLEEERVNAGLIAEEVADLGLEEFVIREEDGTPRSIPYENLTALLIKAIQELKAENDALKARLDAAGL